MPWIFGSFLVTPCAWQAVTYWLVNRTARSEHSVWTGVWPEGGENHAVRFRESAENRCRARDSQPTKGVSDELTRACKCWHPKSPGRRYGKKKSSLWVYVSPPTSHTPEKHKKCGRYIFLKKCVRSFVEVRKFCLCFRLYMYITMQPRYLKPWRFILCQEVKESHLFIFTNPSVRAGYDTRSIFKRNLTSFNSEFSFSETSCLPKAEELSLSYYLPIAGGRIIGFIPFSRVIVLCEMQLVRFRIWTRVAVSIYYDNNHYTTGTSKESHLLNVLIDILCVVFKDFLKLGPIKCKWTYLFVTYMGF